ncbi:hypothetical protein CRS_26200 [Chryseobacterium sp. ON_d1]|nr:hypothetical protein CRS_26200 [Chryseobacterium sp. ON_d1]
MKYTVGKYVIVPPKPFPSLEKAVQYIQEAYPELDNETIEKHIQPKFNSDGENKSTNTPEKSSAGKEHSSKSSSTGSKGV